MVWRNKTLIIHSFHILVQGKQWGFLAQASKCSSRQVGIDVTSLMRLLFIYNKFVFHLSWSPVVLCQCVRITKTNGVLEWVMQINPNLQKAALLLWARILWEHCGCGQSKTCDGHSSLVWEAMVDGGGEELKPCILCTTKKQDLLVHNPEAEWWIKGKQSMLCCSVLTLICTQSWPSTI